jgi:hypothetical protein
MKSFLKPPRARTLWQITRDESRTGKSHPGPVYRLFHSLLKFRNGTGTGWCSQKWDRKRFRPPPVRIARIPFLVGTSRFGQPFLPLAGAVFSYIYTHMFQHFHQTTWGGTKACSPLPCAVRPGFLIRLKASQGPTKCRPTLSYTSAKSSVIFFFYFRSLLLVSWNV